MPAPDLVVCDVGNTALKVVRFGPRGAVRAAARFTLSPEAGAAFAASWIRESPRPTVVVSVHGGHLDALERALGAPPVPVLGRDLPVPMENRTRRPGETGVDRLCAAAAAHARAGGPAVAVGLGTALTVDAVDAAGGFLGGSIGPGLRAAAAGLRAAAPGLPGAETGPGRRVPFPGRTTEEALRAGFLLGFAGMVDRLAGEAARAASSARLPRRRGRRRVPVFLHGGDAPSLLPHLAGTAVHAPHLVAEGARLLWLRSPRP